MNQQHLDVSKVDVIGLEQLEYLLRQHIDSFLESKEIINGRKCKGSYNRLSEDTGISSNYLHKFHTQTHAVCMSNLNKIAHFFGVKYVVLNFDPK